LDVGSKLSDGLRSKVGSNMGSILWAMIGSKLVEATLEASMNPMVGLYFILKVVASEPGLNRHRMVH
jgi:hypothetical protein